MRAFITVICDKNLGPEIIERDEYIRLALVHVIYTTTNRRISHLEARIYSGQFCHTIKSWITCFNTSINNNERKLLLQSLTNCKEAFGTFYSLMKIHKSPTATHPLLSASGTLFSALGIWVDAKLQPFARHQPAYFKSSVVLK
jgi:hypothetical protein